MSLDPEVLDFLLSNPAGDIGHLDTVRQRRYKQLMIDLNFLRFGLPGPEVHEIADHAVPAPGGHRTARLYRPRAGGRLPAHLYLHGGGWWQGSIDDLVNDALCRRRCAEAGVVVVSLEYRLAPEHPFPAALEDAHAALRWLRAEADGLGIDPAGISVGGSSAGANVAAALALQVRDCGEPAPAMQLLEVPFLDLTLESARAAATAQEAPSLLPDLVSAVEFYLRDPGLARDPYVSPALAPSLAGLPPTVVLTAEHDPLHAEGERYAERVTADGGLATAVRYPGALHGTSLLLTRTWAPARDWQDAAIDWLRMAHWDPGALRLTLEGG
ncbi:alpha/beta hydrolase [Acrocarpospora catenulata]|uniref:alpha/beta hydrolase n=1 Tax=Acrocarpospora catenulata TaxID=2836182 RepID=UPI001BDA5A31|nr:alpha/beta hydrolase [Acrocarpospora catenulata]